MVPMRTALFTVACGALLAAAAPAGAQIAITPDGSTVYDTNFSSGPVLGAVVTPISVASNTAGPSISVGTLPTALAITPAGATAYVADAGGTVTPVDTASSTAGPPITAGPDPGEIAITPDGTTAYVANDGGDTVTPISTASNTAGPPIKVGSAPTALVIKP
jgi:YVTN family beta-propeller protein